jgi:hypothetical protein
MLTNQFVLEFFCVDALKEREQLKRGDKIQEH